jgi:hypothetical protein
MESELLVDFPYGFVFRVHVMSKYIKGYAEDCQSLGYIENGGKNTGAISSKLYRNDQY